MKRVLGTVALLVLWIFVSGASAKTVYTVRKGDNLGGIARKYHLSAGEIEKANKVDSRRLRPGTKLVIPVREKGKKAAKRPEAAPDAAASAVPGTVQEGSEKTSAPEQTAALGSTAPKPDRPDGARTEGSRYHLVRKGDTLTSIAKKHSVSVSDIKALNGMKSARLRTGQKLMVKRSGPRTYTVRKGDNLWKIARKFDMDADDLMEINELSSPAVKVGQRIFLDERPEAVNVDQKYLVMATTVEEEIRKVAESPDFGEMSMQDKVVIFAKKLLNIPYKFGGSTILGIDCSAYVKKVYGLMGIDLPRTARAQFEEGQEIEKEELSIGDLVFFRTYASFPSHVGIYLGNNLFIHASSKGKKVTINSLDTPYYLKRFIGAKRLLSEAPGDKVASVDNGN